MTRISLLVTWGHAQPEILGGEYGFQTVDTDFSPGDCQRSSSAGSTSFMFQTVDTDFSPGDAKQSTTRWNARSVSDR